MDELTVKRLHERNDAIIRAVIEKSAAVCPGALELIGITGSFQSGSFYEKSDLDLLIVIGDERGYKLAKCFILDDIGFDIYCKTWDDLERAAKYEHPQIKNIMECDIVYSSDAALGRYLEIRSKLKAVLDAPIDKTLITKVRGHYNEAVRCFGEMQLAESAGECRYASAGLLWACEYALFMLNREYVHSSVVGIPHEICSLKLLPDGFEDLYYGLIGANNIDEMRSCAVRLLRAVGKLIDDTEKLYIEKTIPTADQLVGSYEEIYSNWYNKMQRASSDGDRYLSLMTMAACQQFYDEMGEALDTGYIDMFGDDFPDDISLRAVCFDTAKEKWRALYDNAGISVVRYDSPDEFTDDYLK